MLNASQADSSVHLASRGQLQLGWHAPAVVPTPASCQAGVRPPLPECGHRSGHAQTATALRTRFADTNANLCT